jgi:hypothetical protein
LSNEPVSANREPFAIGFEAYFSPAISVLSPPLRKIGFELQIPPSRHRVRFFKSLPRLQRASGFVFSTPKSLEIVGGHRWDIVGRTLNHPTSEAALNRHLLEATSAR